MTYRFPGEPAGVDWDAVHDYGDVPDTVIARRLGVTPCSVRRQRVKRGYPSVGAGNGRRAGEVNWSEVLDLGISTDTEIAKRLGIPRGHVQSARCRLSIAATWLETRQDDIRRALDMRRKGALLSEIAFVCGVTESTVSRWLK